MATRLSKFKGHSPQDTMVAAVTTTTPHKQEVRKIVEELMEKREDRLIQKLAALTAGPSLTVGLVTGELDRDSLQGRAVGQRLEWTVDMGGVGIKGQVDTGSQVTLVTKDVFCRTKGAQRQPFYSKLTAANGQAIPALGCFATDITHAGHKVADCVVVIVEALPGGLSCLLGMNFLSRLPTFAEFLNPETSCPASGKPLEDNATEPKVSSPITEVEGDDRSRGEGSPATGVAASGLMAVAPSQHVSSFAASMETFNVQGRRRHRRRRRRKQKRGPGNHLRGVSATEGSEVASPTSMRTQQPPVQTWREGRHPGDRFNPLVQEVQVPDSPAGYYPPVSHHSIPNLSPAPYPAPIPPAQPRFHPLSPVAGPTGYHSPVWVPAVQPLASKPVGVFPVQELQPTPFPPLPFPSFPPPPYPGSGRD